MAERIEGDSATATFEISNEATADDDKGTAQFADAGESVWVGFTRRYLFERYEYGTGKRLKRIAADYPYFPAGRPRAELMGADSVAGVTDVAVDGRGRLLTLHIVRPLTRRPTNTEGRPVTTGLVPEPWKAVIQVFHPTSGRMIARHIAQRSRLVKFADANHVYTLAELEDGTPVAEVFRISVVQPNSKEVCE
jgi:hypothetical protein